MRNSQERKQLLLCGASLWALIWEGIPETSNLEPFPELVITGARNV